MSLIIKPIKAFTDNYIWTLVNDTNKQAIVIDPGQASPVVNYLKEYDLELTAIWITHPHHDHIGGVAELRELFPMTHVVSHSEHNVNPDQVVKEGAAVNAWGLSAQVWEVPGHTEHHLMYILNQETQRHVFCGDTLFSAGCGRVFSGTIQELFDSLQRINSLEDNALLYPAHEYTESNLRFGLTIEPNNPVMLNTLQSVIEQSESGRASLPVTLEHERQVNVFLRVNEASVITGVQTLTDLEDLKPFTIFKALRQLKDNF